MAKQLLRSMSCMLMLVFMAAPVLGQNIQISMVKLKQLKAVERRGDELYLDIIGATRAGKPIFLRIPHAPHHWLSSMLDKLKPVPLWQGELAAGNGLALTISLIEKDAPPWNLDDLLGSVRIQLTNLSGKVYLTMTRPNRLNQRRSHALKQKEQQSFILEDDKYGRYELTLAVTKVKS